MDIDIQEYLDEVNELADELEAAGDVNAVVRLGLTVNAVGMQLGVDLTYSGESFSDPYLDTVPP